MVQYRYFLLLLLGFKIRHPIGAWRAGEHSTTVAIGTGLTKTDELFDGLSRRDFVIRFLALSPTNN